ncbi:hypothetical protein DRO69_07305 [Candidatus Bathyarchaeota archaeon]|nr:MAG: hypothetical protein DRO69_07305 [Candidatus Bathyarchaeota archaeon]
MDIQELIEEAKKFENNTKAKRIVEKAWQQHKKFLRLYPFREHPEDIDLLTSDKIYKPGAEDYFFLWIEHRLRPLGALWIGSASVWESARNQLDKLKELLKTMVDDSLSLSQKIDAHWEDIKWFGGDRHIAKKIISCYYPNKVIPIFNTEHLEHFASKLNLEFKKRALEEYGKPYDILSIGQKFELFNNLLFQLKNKHREFKKWDNSFFVRFLYEIFPPQKPPEPRKPLYSLGILFEPEYEQEVLYLFSVFHRELGFPYIIKIQSHEFPDAIVMNKNKETKTIEFEVRASDFLTHKHDKKGCDYIVCWENDLAEDQYKDLPEIISIKNSTEEFT